MSEYKLFCGRKGGKSHYAEILSRAVDLGYSIESARIMADRFNKGDLRIKRELGLGVDDE